MMFPAAPPLQVQSVARLGSDRSFVIAEFDKKTCTTHLRRLVISETGAAQSITSARVEKISGGVEQIAASANGKVLGFALSPCGHGGLQMAVIHLATGQVTRWDMPGVGGSPSLNADGSVLGFVSSRTVRAQKVSAWTIRTDAPAGPLYKYARKAFELPKSNDAAVLSPSGAQMYLLAQPASSKDPTGLDLYSTSTGTLIRHVLQLSPAGQNQLVEGIALDAASRHLLVYGPGNGTVVKEFDLKTRHHRSLPATNLLIDGTVSTLAW
jgi:hypothetical protein